MAFVQDNSPVDDPVTDDDSVSDDDETLSEGKIIELLTAKYMEEEGAELLGKTLEHLRDNINPGVCLICIEDIEHNEAVWSCKSCHCMLHLVCIQRWGKDSMNIIREKAAQQGFSLPIIWCCPKCRKSYPENEFPDIYKCFCGKAVNPKVNQWLIPHSCGDECNKPLQPQCGHTCILLCHSGSCPPCPKNVTVSCFCGKSVPETRRCSMKYWSCDKICGKQLPCSEHTCTKRCHDSECPPCEIPVTLFCRCSSPAPLVFPCHSVTQVDENDKPCVVSCGKKCNKPLNCGIHKCARVCHEDSCGPCQIVCPCGKDSVACSGQEVGPGKPCQNECQKELNCGMHTCAQKCHMGSCGQCLQIVQKKCRCAQLEKEVSCSKDLVCEFKCKKLKDCKFHSCNRKCCVECPPCTATCGKTLACKNHKCESACNHLGQCYPCPVTVQVKCRCGSSARVVPCGFERNANSKPPECSQLCTRPSKCDHPKIQNHRCHFGDCPKCTLTCGKKMVCSHNCKKACHAIKQKGSGANGTQKISSPCGPCREMIPSECKLHTGVLIKCYKRHDRCDEVCGKLLSCGKHTCHKICHETTDPNGCGVCREPCSLPRPEGCHHECDLGCHEGPCSVCVLVAKVPCHCGQEEMMVSCFKQTNLTESERSCKNQCIKKLSCHHRCLSLCHSGECPETEKCRRKVKVTCRCRHLKKDLECFLLDELLTVEGKFLECNPVACNIQKSPKDTPLGASKKRNRKKKASESDKDLAAEGSTQKKTAESDDQSKKDGSAATDYKKIVVLLVVMLFLAASVLIMNMTGPSNSKN